MALFSRLALLQQRQRNRRHLGSSGRKVIPRWHNKSRANMSASQRQFPVWRDYSMRHPSAFVTRQHRRSATVLLLLGWCFRWSIASEVQLVLWSSCSHATLIRKKTKLMNCIFYILNANFISFEVYLTIVSVVWTSCDILKECQIIRLHP